MAAATARPTSTARSDSSGTLAARGSAVATSTGDKPGAPCLRVAPTYDSRQGRDMGLGCAPPVPATVFLPEFLYAGGKLHRGGRLAVDAAGRVTGRAAKGAKQVRLPGKLLLPG